MSDISNRAVSVPQPNIDYPPTAWEIEVVRKRAEDAQRRKYVPRTGQTWQCQVM
jgi:hypothetical protein